jgi:hypothetical protein
MAMSQAIVKMRTGFDRKVLSGRHQSCIENPGPSIKIPASSLHLLPLATDRPKIENSPKNSAKLGGTWQKLANSSSWDFPDCVPALQHSITPPPLIHQSNNPQIQSSPPPYRLWYFKMDMNSRPPVMSILNFASQIAPAAVLAPILHLKMYIQTFFILSILVHFDTTRLRT